MRMRMLALAALLGSAFWVQPVAAQSAADPPQALRPYASDGGTVEVSPARPVEESEDAVNAVALAETVDGLVVVVTIDGAAVTLDSATPARVPRSAARADRELTGDVVRATGMAGGQRIASSVTPDAVLNASEGEGLVRTTRRQITLGLAADRAIESVEIEAPATGARATLDVRAAYTRFCEADPDGKWCPRPR